MKNSLLLYILFFLSVTSLMSAQDDDKIEKNENQFFY